jgi:integrase
MLAHSLKSFRKIMKQARIAQGLIRERNQQGRSVSSHSFHSLRHSFSTIFANNNVSEEVRMRLTGHTTRDVHQKYTHHDLEVFQAAIGVLPRLGDKGLNRLIAYDCRAFCRP